MPSPSPSRLPHQFVVDGPLVGGSGVADTDGTLATDPTTPSGFRETLTQTIAINFIDYGQPRQDQPATAATRDVMFVSGRFGLKSFDITNPTVQNPHCVPLSSTIAC